MVTRTKARLERVVGGRQRARIVALFACVLALESADLAAVGAAGPQLQRALHITNTQLGLLAAISTLVGALVTLPAGVLVDRLPRARLLAGAVALWGGAMAAGAAAQGYEWLLLSRVGLGAVTAAAGPVIASLTGDFFPAKERAKIYGYILSGELIGAGVGFVVSGSAAGALSWRWAFAVLVVPAALLALVIWRRLPEPTRGAQSQITQQSDGIARKVVAAQEVAPVPSRILREDPARMPLRRAVRYVLRIRTNVWVIVASAIGYFFFAGLRTFGVVFVRGHFSLGQATATVVLFLAGVGSFAGVLVGGRLADRLMGRGRVNARVVVPIVCYVIAALLLVPSLLVTAIAVALPLIMLAGAALSAANPPLDAARLDVVPALLWGRAEGVRTLLRQVAQAAAPLVFGVLADQLGAKSATVASQGHVSQATARGLDYTFLIMLVPLALNGVALLGARRSYAADVATAAASEREAGAAGKRAPRHRGRRVRGSRVGKQLLRQHDSVAP